MSLKGKIVFTRKPNKGFLYKWAPQTQITDKKVVIRKDIPFCNAIAYAIDGEDKITQYVTKREVIDGYVKNSAYVACDYVQ